VGKEEGGEKRRVLDRERGDGEKGGMRDPRIG
jgi:hypothetical protein